jgi:hypothetical protein
VRELRAYSQHLAVPDRYVGVRITSPSRFRTTKPPELKFRALLTEGRSEVLFHRDASDRIGQTLGLSTALASLRGISDPIVQDETSTEG